MGDVRQEPARACNRLLQQVGSTGDGGSICGHTPVAIRFFRVEHRRAHVPRKPMASDGRVNPASHRKVDVRIDLPLYLPRFVAQVAAA